jgi:hypothetical protein
MMEYEQIQTFFAFLKMLLIIHPSIGVVVLVGKLLKDYIMLC